MARQMSKNSIFDFVDIVDRADVRVIESRRSLSLAPEARRRLGSADKAREEKL